MSESRRRTVNVIAVLAIAGSLTLSALPAHAASYTWAHGSTFTLCMKDLSTKQASYVKQGYSVGKANACKPNPYRSGWWRTSFSFWR